MADMQRIVLTGAGDQEVVIYVLACFQSADIRVFASLVSLLVTLYSSSMLVPMNPLNALAMIFLPMLQLRYPRHF